MEVAATRTATPSRRWALSKIDTHAVSAWVLAGALVIYLAVAGGGYSMATHGQVGILVWWAVVLCAAWGLLPVTRLTRSALAVMGLFGAFTAWTAIGIAWSISSGRSFQDLALVTCYFGVIVLAVSIHREREAAVRHTLGAVASAIVVVALLALSSRFWPNLFPASHETSQFLGGARARLSWPLNYWNALATLMAVGVPLLLAVATSARTLRAQAAATAAVPVVALCSAFTLSRGGVIEGVVAVAVFLLLAPDRLPKLLTVGVAAAGSAVVVYGGLHRHALQQGLINSTASHQARSLILVILLTCAGVAFVQAGVGLVVRHATPPSLLQVTVGRARLLGAVAVVVIVVAAIAAGAPGHLHHAWEDFKSPVTSISGSSTSRFGSSSGEGRYQYWVAAVKSAEQHVLTGSGPGTFQLDWLPRAPFQSYVVNAHSLYFETYAELGLIGLVLLVGFLVAALAAVARFVIRSQYEDRTRAAAIAAALAAFLVAAAFDWVWQMPVVPVAVLLPLGAALAPGRAASADADLPGASAGEASAKRHGSGLVPQVALVVAGLVCLIAIAYPLASNNAVTSSQSAAAAGNTTAALSDAQSAVRLEPGSAANQLQLALVLESNHSYRQALVAVKRATSDEPDGWTNWLIQSRIQAENDNAHGSLVAYLKAKSLNPWSSLFRKT